MKNNLFYDYFEFLISNMSLFINTLLSTPYFKKLPLKINPEKGHTYTLIKNNFIFSSTFILFSIGPPFSNNFKA